MGGAHRAKRPPVGGSSRFPGPGPRDILRHPAAA